MYIDNVLPAYEEATCDEDTARYFYWFNLLKPTVYVMPTLYLCVLYLSENKQRLVPLTA
jgi:hypothetical protein